MIRLSQERLKAPKIEEKPANANKNDRIIALIDKAKKIDITKLAKNDIQKDYNQILDQY